MLTYRAVCPECRQRLPRVEAFSWTTRTRCTVCGSALRQNLLWAFALTISVMFPTAVLGLLMFIDALRIAAVLGFFVLFMLIAFVLFPYVISYRVEPEAEEKPKEPAPPKKPYRSFVWKLAKQFWLERLTICGRYLVLGGIVTIMAGSVPSQMVGAYTFSCLAVLGLLGWLMALLVRPPVRLHRTGPARCMVGTSVPLSIRMTNLSDRALSDVGVYEFRLPGSVKLAESPKYVAELPAGGSRRFEYTLQATRRGVYQLPGPTALCSYPFAVINAKKHTPDAHRLVVYPSFVPLKELSVPMSPRYQPGGVVLASHVGESMEFVGNREYRVGDRIRDLHPRSWARVGMPIVKQHEEEFLTRVAMVVDTHLPNRFSIQTRRVNSRSDLPFRTQPRQWFRAGEAQEPRRWVLSVGRKNEWCMEANLSLAAAVAEYLARCEYVVDLFAAGPEMYHFQAGRSLAYLDNILDVLAGLEPSDQDPFRLIGPAMTEQLRQTSTVVALLLHWNRRREEFLQRVREAGAKVKAVLVTESASQSEHATAWGATVVHPREVAGGVE
ncbi:MAG: DUF58 domain-containing protein, partial [Phycisphaeraceae bacterium]|nr:DUF58 domain-containing protein [Phycisphaeraceae bacterium]